MIYTERASGAYGSINFNVRNVHYYGNNNRRQSGCMMPGIQRGTMDIAGCSLHGDITDIKVLDY